MRLLPFQARITFSNGALIEASRIAVWNKDKIIVTISAGLWVVNVATITQGKSYHLPSHRCSAISYKYWIHQGLCGSVINIGLIDFRQPKLIYLQARSAWVSSRSSCAILNTEENKLNIIVTLVLHVVLLLTMLAGLFRLRRDGSGRFGIAQLLWNQVGSWWFPCLWCSPSTDMFSVRKNILGLLIATLTGVPTTVGPYIFSYKSTLRSSRRGLAGVYLFESEWYCSVLEIRCLN